MRRMDVFTVDYLSRSRSHGLFGGPEGDRQAQAFVGERDGQRVVDFGTGLGYFLALIEGVSRSTALLGIDLREDLIAEARQRVCPTRAGNTVEFRVADARNTRLPSDSFDLVTCCTLLEHPSRPEEILAEMIRVAKPGGQVVAVSGIDCPHLAFDVDPERKARAWADQEDLLRRTADPESDHEIGIKIPYLFQKHGLCDVEMACPAFARPQREGSGVSWEQCRILLHLWIRGVKG